MSKDGVIVGVSDHNGWAVLVTLSRAGTLLDRRRVELLDDGLRSMPHHHEGQALPLEEAVKLVERVRASAECHAERILEAVARDIRSRIQGIALRECPQLLSTVAERITNYRAQCVADWVMYRNALARAAAKRGWAVHWYDAKTVIAAARDALHVEDLEPHFLRVRKSVGPPRGKDHKIAMAAAIVAARAPQA